MREGNTNIYVYQINEQRIHLYRQFQFMRKQKKEVNLQYFEGMNLKFNPKFGRTEFNI